MKKDDLLNFQIAHFGDATRPDRWFVPAEEALNFKVFEEIEEDDGLGYYPDGVKRTLTDEQIAIFRRTELWQMKWEQDRQREEQRAQRESEERAHGRAQSPASDSSLEDELVAWAASQRKQDSPPPSSPQQSNNERGETAISDASRKRKRSEEVPYDQRHKRKWEQHIAEIDEDEGSLTHRRLARELDNQQTETFDMDY